MLGELTFSKRYGFLDAGKDVDNIIRDLEMHFDKVSLVSRCLEVLIIVIQTKITVDWANAMDRHTLTDRPSSLASLQTARLTDNDFSVYTDGREAGSSKEATRKIRHA